MKHSIRVQIYTALLKCLYYEIKLFPLFFMRLVYTKSITIEIILEFYLVNVIVFVGCGRYTNMNFLSNIQL